jgi:transaldolase
MASDKTTLQQLLDQGQSPWLDNISRVMLRDGAFQALLDRGIVGMTSNPSIFQKAIGGSDAYDDELRRLVRAGKSAADIYDDLVLDDIRAAAALLRPVYEGTGGRDGYVSIEVAPALADDTERTLREARRLFSYLNRPNVMIKIPGTPAGIPAIRQAIANGINVNVTLLFAVESYRAVAEAYLAGLEERAAAGWSIGGIASVASFFVSRVDTAVDKRLDALIEGADDAARTAALGALKGTAAIANARVAYAAFGEVFAGPRWAALAAKGARTQRPLWASTSVKTPGVRDVRYVEELIGPDTVDTMPDATIAAVLDHGVVRRTLDADVAGARAALERLARAGIALDEITERLQRDGVAQFAAAFDDLNRTIAAKRTEMTAPALTDGH